jgi:hypothetical protein
MADDEVSPSPELDPRLLEPGTERTVDALVDTVRALLEEENRRDESFNLRGIAVVGLAGIIGSASISLGRAALKETWSFPWKGVAVALFAVALIVLVMAAFCVLIRVLDPREAATLGISEVERYELPEYVFAPKVMNQGTTLRGLIEALGIERSRINKKSGGLKVAYRLLLAALATLAVLGFLLGLRDARIIRPRSSKASAHRILSTPKPQPPEPFPAGP